MACAKSPESFMMFLMPSFPTSNLQTRLLSVSTWISLNSMNTFKFHPLTSTRTSLSKFRLPPSSRIQACLSALSLHSMLFDTSFIFLNHVKGYYCQSTGQNLTFLVWIRITFMILPHPQCQASWEKNYFSCRWQSILCKQTSSLQISKFTCQMWPARVQEGNIGSSFFEM